MPTLPHVLLVTGPPFGASFFHAVGARLGDAEAIELCDETAPNDGWQERGVSLAGRLAERKTVLVAHGLAVPAAVHAALVLRPQALVLVNGPLTRVDPVTRALARAAAVSPTVAATTWLQPTPFLRWLWSSVGLRRAVVNPYAMDRDTVVALCGAPLRTTGSRRAVAAYLRSLAGALPDPRSLACPVVLAWGDEDLLYPMSEADCVVASNDSASCRTVPGGRFGHPHERPWALADIVATVCHQTTIAA